MTHTDKREPEHAKEFASEAQRRSRTVLGEFFGLLRDNKKWWLAPIILILLLVGVFLILLGTPVAPLIYTLF